MAFPKIDDARQLSDDELSQAVVDAKRQLFTFRLQQATRQLEKTHEFKHLKHRIAQLLTVEREREIAAERKAVSSPAKTAPAPEEE